MDTNSLSTWLDILGFLLRTTDAELLNVRPADSAYSKLRRF